MDIILIILLVSFLIWLVTFMVPSPPAWLNRAAHITWASCLVALAFGLHLG